MSKLAQEIQFHKQLFLQTWKTSNHSVLGESFYLENSDVALMQALVGAAVGVGALRAGRIISEWFGVEFNPL